MRSKYTAITIHVIVWALLLLVPYLSTYQVLKSFYTAASYFTFTPLLVLSFVLVGIFYLNYFLLIPKYLLPRKYWTYIMILLLSIIIAFLLSGFIFYSFGLGPVSLAKINPIFVKISPIARANAFLMLTIVIIGSILLAINTRLKETEEERFSAQIAALKSQINPHFLFNTLNSIYATAIDTSPHTADMVEKLSTMMRYSLSETQHDFVPLEEEIQYLENYIDLQRIRLDEQVELEFSCIGDLSGLQIAPMLLISFIENAFKYGVNPEEKSDIKIYIEVKQEELHLLVRNHKVHVQTDTSESGGLGIKNTKHRLQLMYPSKHLLAIKETENDFTVSLHIQLQ